MAQKLSLATPGEVQSAFGFSREIREKLLIYEKLLLTWQKTINLVAPSTLTEVWHRHLADSAQLWALRPAPDLAALPQVWLDFGSGAGFPGLVLAILASEQGQTRHILVESDSRKAAFLREVARATSTTVDILCMRIESLSTRAKVSRADCVTARALAPMPRLLDLVAPYFGPSTVGMFLKGREFAAEVEEAAKDFRFDYDLKPSLTDDHGRIVVIRELSRR